MTRRYFNYVEYFQLCINIARDVRMITAFPSISNLPFTLAQSLCARVSVWVYMIHVKVRFDRKWRSKLFVLSIKWYWHHNELANKQKLNEAIKSILNQQQQQSYVSIDLNQRKLNELVTVGRPFAIGMPRNNWMNLNKSIRSHTRTHTLLRCDR